MNYLKKNILNPQSYEENREKCVNYRLGAISTAFDELDGILNDSALVRDYMECAEPDFNAKKEATQLPPMHSSPKRRAVSLARSATSPAA